MPSLYVLSRPNFSDEVAKFLSAEKSDWSRSGGGAAEQLIEFAGRICYMSFGPRQSKRSNDAYIRNLIEQGHESVLEHANWTFVLSGVSRAFTHQLVRHRVGFAFSQLSQQYHDESDTSFVPPAGIEDQPEIFKVWRDSVDQSLRAYRLIVSQLLPNNQVSKETTRSIRSAARSVLPNATETKIVVTANARAIRHFLAVRGAIEGDIEMRNVSKLIYDLISRDAPSLVYDFFLDALSDGSPIVRRRDRDG